MGKDCMAVLRREERITLELRRLYEQYGYRKYRMGRFEEYELYLENKRFLRDQNIITFHDLDGRVMALKPDVTLSIAKNTHATAASSEKFYYLENVYRLDKQSGGYREINQLGLEYIGRLNELAYAEVLRLAQQTLDEIGKNHRMQVSHIGFWVSLLDGLGIEPMLRRTIMDCVRAKRIHELMQHLEEARIAPAASSLIQQAAGLCGPFDETLMSARAISICPGMTEALNELEAVNGLLRHGGWSEHLLLDFSLVNDSDYYGGLIFQGYVEGVPRALLAGGYYGNLLKKFGKDLDAIGFAVYLNELNLLFRSSGQNDVDALILYTEDAEREALLSAAEDMMQKGLRVRLEPSMPEEIRCGAVYTFGKDGLEEVGKNA